VRNTKNQTPLPILFLFCVISGIAGIALAWFFFGTERTGIISSAITLAFCCFGLLIGFRGWFISDDEPDRAALDRAVHVANHDQLTQLMNRTGMMNELELSLKETREEDMVLGVLFLDLNRFKLVNDTMGHEAGDQLLQIVAERLKTSVRSTDVVARFGGDEFVILCRGLLSADSVISVAKAITKAFMSPVQLSGNSHMASTSIGVAIFDKNDTRTPEDLVRDADSAMFVAKRNKLGYSVFDEEQHDRSVERMEVERGLTAALQENQFTVFYQPIVDVSGQNIYAFEALVRWNHPERGLLSPGSFLDVAEEAGMLGKIGEIVLREACAQVAVWNHLSPVAKKIKMSVNLSEQQLLDGNLQFLVADILSWAGIEPTQLILEITEDIIVDHLDSLDALRRLKELGVSLAIDDFGTGQSSLNSIKQLDMVATLKIAEKFVTDMNTSDADRAIIEAIVAMAKALDMNIIAEGIEKEAQINSLLELGVKNMQGYFFSRPLPAESIDPNQWFSRNEIAQTYTQK